MKRSLLLVLMICGFAANAQVTNSCSVVISDTLTYVESKSSSIVAISMNEVNDGGSYGYAGYAQKFEAPDTISLSGFCFYGIVYAGSATDIDYYVYSINGSGMPDTVTTSGTITMPLVAGYTGPWYEESIKVCVDFGSNVEITGDYIVGLQNFSSADLYVTRNVDGDGAAENLGYTYYKGVSDPSFDGWYQTYPFGSGWNFDLVFEPVVEYEFNVMSMYEDTLCLGDTLAVDIDLLYTDSVFANRMYNPFYSVFNGLNGAYQFDYGDGGAVSSDTSNVYTSGGTFNVSQNVLFSSLFWSGDASESCMFDVEVIDPYYDVLDQNACVGDSVYFIAASGYDAYTWSDMSTDDSLLVETNGMSNGDYMYYVDYELNGCLSSDTMTLTIGDLLVDLGGDTTLCLNQNVMLTAGTFDSYDWNTGQTTESIQVGPFVSAGAEEIILTVTQGSCSGSDTLLVTVDNCLGIEQPSHIALEVFPNPSNGKIFVNSEGTVQKVILRSLSGSVIGEWSVKNGDALILPNLADGTYLIQVETSEGTGYKKIQIIH